MLYNVNASLQYKFLYLSNICVSSSVGKDWYFLERLLNCTKMEKVQAAFPTTVPTEKGAGKNHDYQRIGFRWSWRSAKSSSRLYVSNTMQRKVGGPFRRCVQEGAQGSEAQGGPSICQNMGRNDLSSGDESDSESPPMSNPVSARLTIHSGWLTL